MNWPLAILVAAIIAIVLLSRLTDPDRRRAREVWPGADDVKRRREAAGRASTRAMYAITEAAQYHPWNDNTSVIAVEDLLPPPSGVQLVIVTPSRDRAQHAVRRAGLNPDNVKIVRYPWQVPPPIDCGPALRVAVLADAYQLEHWPQLQDEFARRPNTGFLLLQT